MTDLTPRVPYRPLLWPDFVFGLQDVLADMTEPAYIVGGAVRDALLHRPVKDLDLTVAQDGIRLARRIANLFKGDFYPLDVERDVGRALVETREGRLVIDVARFRGATLLDDLADRDFTINAMAVDLSGDLNRLIDPLGGEADVKDKVLRRCSDHALTDDPLRGLRAVRQSVQLGLRIENATREDVRASADSLPGISAERLRDEFIKMLALPKAVSAVRVSDALRLLDVIVPEVRALRDLTLPDQAVSGGWEHTLVVVESIGYIMAAFTPGRSEAPASFGIGSLVMQLDRYRGPLLRHLQMLWPDERPHYALLTLAALLHDAGAGDDLANAEARSAALARTRAGALRLSNAEAERLETMVRHHKLPAQLDNVDDLALHRFWYRYGVAGVDICLLALANMLGAAGNEIPHKEWLSVVDRVRLLLQAYYERYDEVVAPVPFVDGNQLMQALNLTPGPLVGELMSLIREAQVVGQVRNAEDAIQIARARLHE